MFAVKRGAIRVNSQREDGRWLKDEMRVINTESKRRTDPNCNSSVFMVILISLQ